MTTNREENSSTQENKIYIQIYYKHRLIVKFGRLCNIKFLLFSKFFQKKEEKEEKTIFILNLV